MYKIKNLLLGIFIILASTLYAQDIGVQVFSEENYDSVVSNIIRDTIQLELKIESYTALEKNDENAAYSILYKYTANSGSYFISVRCFRLEGNTLIYENSAAVPLSLKMDKDIQDLCRPVVLRINEDIALNPPSEESETIVRTEVSEENDSLKNEEEASLDSPTDESTQNEAAAPEKDVQDNDAEIETEISISEEAIEIPQKEPFVKDYLPMAVTLAYSHFLALGDATDFFKMSPEPNASWAYRFNMEFGYLGTGVFLPVNYFTAEGLLTNADVLMIGIAPEIQVGLEVNRFSTLLVKINGGAALFTLQKSGERYLKIIPFVTGGIGISLDITQHIGMIFCMNYENYFEGSVLIAGFAPQIGVYYSW